MQRARIYRYAWIALLGALSACDRVWLYRAPDHPRAGTDARPEYVVGAAPNVSYSVGFMWFAGRLCAYGEISNGTPNTIRFHPGRYFFQDGSGRRYLPGKPSGGGEPLEHPVDIPPGQSFKVKQWAEGGPATDGPFGGQRIRSEGRRLLFEDHGIVVGGQAKHVKVSLELQDPG